jgi:chromosome segregation ATPase
LTNSSSVDRDDSQSEILKMESIPHPQDREFALAQQTDEQIDADRRSPATPKKQGNTPLITQSITIPSTGVKLDVTAELDSLLTALQLAMPHPPIPKINPQLVEPDVLPPTDRGSISASLAEIAEIETISYKQLLQELNRTHEQIDTVDNQLQVLDDRNRFQCEAIEANVFQIDRIKGRIEQLEEYTKHRVGKIQELLGAVDGIRAQIVVGLEKFGGYEEIRLMLTELETTRHALVLAHDRLRTGQDAFYESLQTIQSQVSAQSDNAVLKLAKYQESIEDISQNITLDRRQVTEMSLEMSLKFTELQALNSQITDMHSRVTDKSQILQSRIAESVQREKEQFYELTVETIDRTDAIRSQFMTISKDLHSSREDIGTIKSELELVRQSIDTKVDGQLDYFDLQFYELMSNWNELTAERKVRDAKIKQLAKWLWILSVAVGAIFILLIIALLHMK